MDTDWPTMFCERLDDWWAANTMRHLMRTNGGIRRWCSRARRRGAPFNSHNFTSFNTTSNIVRYFYEKPPYNNMECGCMLYGVQPCSKKGCPY